MIHIHKKLWYVVAPDRAEEEDNLAYMTHWEENESFNKRKSTGLNWATPRSKWDVLTGKYVPSELVPQEFIIDNNPIQGIYIGSSVCRWTTSNKLFRVSDPRGFTVEVPTDNIATLLHLTTVINGVILEECVWGKEGNNHILLPVNSQPYLDTLEKMDTLTNKLIKVSELKSGDVVKLFEGDTEHTFLGRGKVTWKVKPYRSIWDYKNRKWSKIYENEGEYTGSGYVNIFKHQSCGNLYYDTMANPKIVTVLRNELLDLTVLPDLCCTNRSTSWSDCDTEVIGVKWK